MNILRISIFSFIILVSCTGAKNISKTIDEVTYAYQSGNYEKSLQLSQATIEQQEAKGKSPDGKLQLYAGLSSWELKQTKNAISYLEKAKQTPNMSSKGYFVLAQAYLQIDNLSREISNLEEFLEKFPNGAEIENVHLQLFTAYVKSANWEQANSLWIKLPEAEKKQMTFQIQYLKVCKNLNLSDEQEKVAASILQSDKKNVDALEVLANKYFWLAENRYQAEMKAYEKIRTNKQYSQLLKALESINENFKISRDYYLRLWEIEKNPKYATYLGNIYSRFDNKERAEYFYRQAKRN